MPNRDLHGFGASIRDLNHIRNIHTDLPREVLTKLLRYVLTLITGLVVANLVILSVTVVFHVALPTRNRGASVTVADLIIDGSTDLLIGAHIAGNGLADRIVSIAALLLVFRVALMIILGVALRLGSLHFVPITGRRDLVRAIEGFEFLGFKIEGLIFLI